MITQGPSPYWFARARPPEEVDLAVIGGGLVGLSVAYWAARRGDAVTVFESAQVAARATGRSTGFLVTGTLLPFTRLAARVGREHALGLWRLSADNNALLRREILDRSPCGFLPEGSWRVARPGSLAEAEWEESVTSLRGEGFAAEWRGAAEVRRAAGSAGLGGGCFQAADGGLDPVLLCRELAARSGAEVRVGAHVRHLEPAGERTLLSLDTGAVLARRLAVTVNAYVAPLLPWLADEVTPLRVQALATAPGRRWLSGVWAITPDGAYLRQLTDGTLLAAGGARPEAADRGFPDLPTAAVQSTLEERLQNLFPQGLEAVTHRWAGTIATTADGLPRSGFVDGFPRAVFATGCNGHGLSVGFALGRRLARLLADDDAAP